jgi:hypothetical protein
VYPGTEPDFRPKMAPSMGPVTMVALLFFLLRLLCVKVDDHEDYHHCYGDHYVSGSVAPFEYGHSSLPV